MRGSAMGTLSLILSAWVPFTHLSYISDNQTNHGRMEDQDSRKLISPEYELPLALYSQAKMENLRSPWTNHSWHTKCPLYPVLLHRLDKIWVFPYSRKFLLEQGVKTTGCLDQLPVTNTAIEHTIYYIVWCLVLVPLVRCTSIAGIIFIFIWLIHDSTCCGWLTYYGPFLIFFILWGHGQIVLWLV